MVKNITIIGAGSAGLLLAHYLLNRNEEKYQINIYECRHDPRKINYSQHKSYPLSLFERGLSALRNIPGLEETVKSQGLQNIGTLVYQKNGKTNLIARNKSLTLINRNTLTITLLEELENKYSKERLKINFDHKCVEVDFIQKIITIAKAEQETLKINYDILVGADGVHSVVRKYLNNLDDFQCQVQELSYQYKVLSTSRTNQEIALEADKLHTRRFGDNTTILAAPQPGDKMSSTIIFNKENNPLTNLPNAESVIEFFENNFSRLAKLITPQAAAEFWQKPVSKVFTVHCNKYHYDGNVIIIGDAAHAVSPALGQGCNSALEDVVVLSKLLDEYQDDWNQVIPEFTSRRAKDLHALAELSENGFPRAKILFLEFILRRQATKLIRKIFPKYESKFMFDTLETTMPYSEIIQLSQAWVNKVKKSNQRILKSQ